MLMNDTWLSQVDALLLVEREQSERLPETMGSMGSFEGLSFSWLKPMAFVSASFW